MSDPKPTLAALVEMEARHAAAWEELLRVTGMSHYAKDVRGGPPNRPRASIPADPKRDTDLVIGASLDDVPALLSEVTRLRGIVAELAAVAKKAHHRFDCAFGDEPHCTCGLGLDAARHALSADARKEIGS